MGAGLYGEREAKSAETPPSLSQFRSAAGAASRAPARASGAPGPAGPALGRIGAQALRAGRSIR